MSVGGAPSSGNRIKSPDGLERVRLFGLDFVDAASLDTVIERIEDPPPASSTPAAPTVVVTPNVDQLVQLERKTDARSERLTHNAQIVLPDGQPIVWASRWLRAPLQARLTGSSLVARLWPRLVDSGRRCVVVASSERIADRVRAEGPNCHALVAPMLRVEDRTGFETFVDRCAELIEATNAEFVFVCLGFPKQNHLIAGLLERSPVVAPTFLAVGASFDLHFGHVRRAPVWIQRVGMEWAFRFVQEPRRLFRRYFIDDPAFILMVGRESRRRRVAGDVRP